jgi:bacterioferritin (cytochrome b1)
MTTTHTDSKALLTELATILRLTRTEAQIARVRTSQAQREEIRQELADNAREADVRARRLQQALRSLGGTPDVLADAVGRFAALVKAGTEQVQPFSEGLLGDLALEHQLRDRVVFARVIAEAQNESAVVDLLHQLEAAHTETIEWITVRLAEVAQGGPAALAPTPTQAVVGRVARLSMLPSRQYATVINRTADALERGRDKVQEQFTRLREQTKDTVEATGEVVEAGRDAALARAERVAPSADVREAARKTRKSLGTIEVEALPIKDYDDLSATAIIEQVNGLDDAEDVRVVLAYEQAHKSRKGVSNAVQKRLSELAEQAITA